MSIVEHTISIKINIIHVIYFKTAHYVNWHKSGLKEPFIINSILILNIY